MRFYTGIGIGLIATLIVLELFFRMLPVSSGMRKENSDAGHRYSRYLPNQEFVYSKGWSMANHRSGVTNREGFVNSPDFTGQHGMLVIGDSFIEALMVGYPDTVQGQLSAALHGNVFAAASSGNDLPDTLELLHQFHPLLLPQVVVIFVKPFELNMLLQPAHNGFSAFVRSGDQFSLVHTPYREAASKQIVMKSALARYIYYNLRLPEWLRTALSSHHAAAPETGLSVNNKTAALEYYFSELRNRAPQTRVIFLIDGDRESIYNSDSLPKSRALRSDSALFSRLAVANGFETVDMQPIFAQHWSTHQERMDFLPMDGHWNPVAHRLAAEAILKQLGKVPGQPGSTP